MEDSFSNPGKQYGQQKQAKRRKVQDLPGLPHICQVDLFFAVTDEGLQAGLAEVRIQPPQLDPQSPGHGCFRPRTVRALMLPAVPPQDTQGIPTGPAQQKRGEDDDQPGKPGGDEIGRVIQLR